MTNKEALDIINSIREEYEGYLSFLDNSIVYYVKDYVPTYNEIKNREPYEKCNDEVENQIKQLKERLVQEVPNLEKYGPLTSETRLLYSFCGCTDYLYVKYLLTESHVAPILRTATSLCRKLDTNELKITLKYMQTFNGFYNNDIELNLHRDYSNEILELLVVMIALEIKRRVSMADIRDKVVIVENEFGINMKLISLEDLIGHIGLRELIYVLSTDFLDEKQWPHDGTVIEFLKDRLKAFEFTKAHLQKLKLMGSDTIYGVSVRSAICIRMLKEIVNYKFAYGGILHDMQ